MGDNVGWGDIGCYGGLAPTRRIDALAAEGQRLRNYNVEAQCSPTRSPDTERLGALAHGGGQVPHMKAGEEFTGY